jgi:serine/threonine protein kinase
MFFLLGMKPLSCTLTYSSPLFAILTTSQTTCDALRLWYLPRYVANAPSEKRQYGNVSSSTNTRLNSFLTSSPSLEYSSPESIPVPPHYTLPPSDSKSDMWSLGMILHKLIFFRLPYRWAAYGDRPGLDGSDANSLSEDDERGNDTDRLEREVSSYPGFKSTARLETLFTSRRLPRSYLVLLESLLNVSPAARPSCEKVLAALHLGKVCSSSSVSPASHELTTGLTLTVQPHSAEIDHVRRSCAQDGTDIRRSFHLIVDPSASRAFNNNNYIASFVPYAAPAPVVTFHLTRNRAATTCKIRREDSVAVAISACVVKVKLARVARTPPVGHGTGVARIQVWRLGAQDCIALRQQRSSAAVGAVDTRWAEYC